MLIFFCLRCWPFSRLFSVTRLRSRWHRDTVDFMSPWLATRQHGNLIQSAAKRSVSDGGLTSVSVMWSAVSHVIDQPCCSRAAFSTDCRQRTRYRPEGQPGRRYHSLVWMSPAVTGTCLTALKDGSAVVDGVQRNTAILCTGRVSTWPSRRRCRCPGHRLTLLGRSKLTAAWSVGWYLMSALTRHTPKDLGFVGIDWSLRSH